MLLCPRSLSHHITSHTCQHQDLCPSGLARFTEVWHALLQTTFFESSVYVGAELFLDTSSVLDRSQTGIKMSSFASSSINLGQDCCLLSSLLHSDYLYGYSLSWVGINEVCMSCFSRYIWLWSVDVLLISLVCSGLGAQALWSAFRHIF